MNFIHIGPHKTGTSTLQHWLATNREPLRQLGCHYPGPRANHNGLAWLIRRRGLEGSSGLTKWFALQRDLAGSSGCAHVILSAESFSRLKDSEVEDVAKVLGREQTRIVCYLRKPWDRKASAHTQHVKQLMPVRILSRLLSFDGDVGTLEEPDDGYLGLLARWERTFGLDRLIVRVLEKEQLHDGDLVSDFLRAIGLPGPRAHSGYTAVTNLNEMPGLDTLRVLNAIDLGRLEGVSFAARRDRIAEPILAGAQALGWNKIRANLLSAELERRFEAAMAGQHAQIARRYLGRADGHLFAPVGRASYEADTLDVGKLHKQGLVDLIGASLEAAAFGEQALALRAAETELSSDPRPASVPFTRWLIGNPAAGSPHVGRDPASRSLIADILDTAVAALGLDENPGFSASDPLLGTTHEQLVALLVESLIELDRRRSDLEQELTAPSGGESLAGSVAANLDEAVEWFAANEPSSEFWPLAQDLDICLENLGRVMRRHGFTQGPARDPERTSA